MCSATGPPNTPAQGRSLRDGLYRLLHPCPILPSHDSSHLLYRRLKSGHRLKSGSYHRCPSPQASPARRFRKTFPRRARVLGPVHATCPCTTHCTPTAQHGPDCAFGCAHHDQPPPCRALPRPCPCPPHMQPPQLAPAHRDPPPQRHAPASPARWRTGTVLPHLGTRRRACI